LPNCTVGPTIHSGESLRSGSKSELQAWRHTAIHWPAQMANTVLLDVEEKKVEETEINSLAVILLLAAVEDNSRPVQERPPIVVVSDGSSGWAGQTATRVAEGLKGSEPGCREEEIVAFDAEPRDLVSGRPRIPMRDAMEAAFVHLAETPGPRTMVVVAHEQFYPSAISSGRLLDLARRTNTTVHTIYLSRKPDKEGFGTRLNRTMRNRFVWFVEEFVVDERGHSARDTERFLNRIAAATGGTACAADEDDRKSDCVGRVRAALTPR
jgi:hypothetical protein